MIFLVPEVTGEAEEVPTSLEQFQSHLFASITSVQEEKEKKKKLCLSNVHLYSYVCNCFCTRISILENSDQTSQMRNIFSSQKIRLITIAER